MARPGVSYEAVEEAVLALINERHAPTVQRVREHLGRGSHSTIAAHLRRFHANRAGPLPQPPPAALQHACEQLWEQAKTLAEETLAGEREALSVREQALLADREDLLRRYQWLRATLAQRDDALSRLQTDQQALQAEMVDLQANRTTLTAQLTRSEQRREAEARQADATEASLRERLAREQDEARARQALFDEQLAAMQRHGDEQQRLHLLELDRLRQQISRLERQTARQRVEAQSREQALQEARQQELRERIQWESRARQLEEQLTHAGRARDQLARALAGSQRMVAQLRGRLARRSGATTASGGDGIQGGAAGGVDGD